jgi:hypothetical protein
LGSPQRGVWARSSQYDRGRKLPMAFEGLKSRGVKFETPEILEFPWGYAARFQDPDGNLLQVREGRRAVRR